MAEIAPNIKANLKAYDRYYSKPAWWFKLRYDTQVKRKTCLALLRTLHAEWLGKKIFELGFGSGDVLFSFPRSCELYGAEISSSAVERMPLRALKRGYHKFQFFSIQQDKPLPLPDDFVDLAIASHVLEHVENDVDTVRELKRIVKPGGAFIAIVPINERFKDPNHVRSYSFDTCRQLCEQNGFRLVTGFQNELLFYLVEKMYWKHIDSSWSFGENVVRVTFNVLTAPLPFRAYRISDFLIARFTKLPARQASLLFVKT